MNHSKRVSLCFLVQSLVYAVIICALSSPARTAELGSLVTVTQDGEIRPAGAVAAIDDLAEAAAAGVAAEASAQAVLDTQAALSNRLDGITSLIASREGFGYVRGHVLEFSGAGIDPESVESSIVNLDMGANDGTNQFVDVYVWFNINPGYAPSLRFGSSLGQTNSWSNAVIVSAVETNVVAGSGVYESWRLTGAFPASASNVLIQAFADIGGAGTNDYYLSVANGISPGGRTPLTRTFYDGSSNVLMVVKGGLIVEEE